MSDDSIEDIRVAGEAGRVRRARAHDVARPEAQPAAKPFGAAPERCHQVVTLYPSLGGDDGVARQIQLLPSV